MENPEKFGSQLEERVVLEWFIINISMEESQKEFWNQFLRYRCFHDLRVLEFFHWTTALRKVCLLKSF